MSFNKGPLILATVTYDDSAPVITPVSELDLLFTTAEAFMAKQVPIKNFQMAIDSFNEWINIGDRASQNSNNTTPPIDKVYYGDFKTSFSTGGKVVLKANTSTNLSVIGPVFIDFVKRFYNLISRSVPIDEDGYYTTEELAVSHFTVQSVFGYTSFILNAYPQGTSQYYIKYYAINPLDETSLKEDFVNGSGGSVSFHDIQNLTNINYSYDYSPVNEAYVENKITDGVSGMRAQLSGIFVAR